MTLLLRLVVVAGVLFALGIQPLPVEVTSLATALSEGEPLLPQAFEEAVALRPYDGDIRALWAQAYLRSGDTRAAGDILSAIESPSPRVLEVSGALAAALGDTPAAIAAWESALAVGGLSPGGSAALCEAYLAVGNWQGALALYRDQRVGGAADASAAYQYALLLALLSPSEAPSAFQAAYALDAAYGPAIQTILTVLSQPDPEGRSDMDDLRLGVAFLAVNEPALAEAALTRAFAANPANGAATAYLAYVREKMGITSLGALGQAVLSEPDNPIVHYLSGLVWMMHDNPIRARAYYRDARELDPANPVFAVEIARTYQVEEKDAIAEQWMLEAVSLANDSYRYRLILAQFYTDSGYLLGEKGLPLARALVEEDPSSAEAHDALGWALFLLGEADEAGEHLAVADSLNSRLPRAHYHLGQYYESRGQLSYALWHYQQALSLDPTGAFAALSREAADSLSG